jgi:hypothetical protein
MSIPLWGAKINFIKVLFETMSSKTNAITNNVISDKRSDTEHFLKAYCLDILVCNIRLVLDQFHDISIQLIPVLAISADHQHHFSTSLSQNLIHNKL